MTDLRISLNYENGCIRALMEGNIIDKLLLSGVKWKKYKKMVKQKSYSE